MFDPTIYENIKVVLEGAVIDLDLAGVILVTDRVDRVDLSTMSRFYSIQFQEKESSTDQALAEIRLSAGAADLAAEILELEGANPGCQLEICFYADVKDDIDKYCVDIEKLLSKIWEDRPKITQQITYIYDENPRIYRNKVKLGFGRKIDEGQTDDLPDLIDYTLQSLQSINDLL